MRTVLKISRTFEDTVTVMVRVEGAIVIVRRFTAGLGNTVEAVGVDVHRTLFRPKVCSGIDT